MSAPTERFSVQASSLGPGIRLLEASAGTGKTWTLAALYVRLVAEQGFRPREILAVTFTEAATAELRSRLRERLHVVERELRGGIPVARPDPATTAIRDSGVDLGLALSRLGAAIAGFDEAAIHTIHGFCQRVLQDEPFLCRVGLNLEIEPDERRLLDGLAEDFWRRVAGGDRGLPAVVAGAVGLDVGKLREVAGTIRNAPLGHRLVLDVQDPPTVAEATRQLEALLVDLAAAASAGLDGWFGALENLSATRQLSTSKQTGYPAARLAALREVMRALPSDPDRWTGTDLAEVSCLARETLVGALIYRAKGRAELIPPHRLPDLAGELGPALARWRAAVLGEWAAAVDPGIAAIEEERSVLTFTGLLRRVAKALEGPTGGQLAERLARRFPVALIDEFQDTDPWQWSIFRSLFRRPNQRLFLIGDPKQAIYGFRGADLATYLEVAESLARPAGIPGSEAEPVGTAASRATLGTNFRSEPGLLAGLNALFSRGAPFGTRIAFDPVDAGREPTAVTWGGQPLARRFRWMRIAGTDLGSVDFRAAAASAAAAQVQAILREARVDGSRVPPNRIAVLVRKGSEAHDVERELARLGIPSVRHAEDSVFATDEARELLWALEAILDPGDESLWHGVLFGPLFGWETARLVALRREVPLLAAERARVERLREAFDEQGFAGLFPMLLSEGNIPARWLGGVGGERRFTNLLQVGELLQELSRRERLGPGALVRTLRDWVGGAGQGFTAPEAHQVRLETDAGAVPIVTVHKSKGLEYDWVVAPFHAVPVFSRLKPTYLGFAALRTWDQDGRPHVDLRRSRERGDSWVMAHEAEGDADEVRLFYVSLTRAREAAFVAFAETREWGDSPLGQVLGDAVLPLLAGDPAGLPAGWADCMAIDEAPVARPRGPLEEPDLAPLACSPARRVFPESNQLSFSKIADALAGGAPLRHPAQEEVADRDVPVLPGIGLAPAEGGEEGEAVAASTPHALPAGARLGDCFHEIYEVLDLADPVDLEEIAGRTCRKYAFPKEDEPVIVDLVRRSLAVELGPVGDRTPLGRLGPGSRRAEVPFALPVRRFDVKAFAAAFRGEGPLEGLADRLEALGIRPVDGHLVGFLDLVAEAGGRFHVVDWKSNRLGPGPESYGAERLDEAMARQGYEVQWSLYGLALHRHLRGRLRGYDPARHLGEAVYVFLRGLDPADPTRGVARRAIEVGRLEAIAAALGVEGGRP